MAGDIYYAGEKIARADFDRDARIIAANMISHGVGADDVIAIYMRNDPVYLQLVLAARLVGVRFATINWHAAPQEVHYIVEDSGAKLIYAHSDMLAGVMDGMPGTATPISVPVPAALSAAFGAQDVDMPGAAQLSEILISTAPYEGEPKKFRGLFAYTSGSTGQPKGIRRKFDPDGPDAWERYRGMATGILGAVEGDRLHVSAPLYHSAPNALCCFVLAAGNVDLFIDPKFDSVDFLQTIHTHKITHAYVVPTMMVRMLKLEQADRDKYDTSSLRFTLSTGSPFPMEIKRKMIDWLGPIFNETYGASEIGFMTLITSQDAMAKPGSVGQILSGGAVKVLDDDMNEVPTGEVGTLYINLPQFGDFEYTNADGALSGQRQGEFTSVGDMGYVDSDGYIFISDRKKDMIISGGANIFPAEIEAQLILMPELADCAVFGAPDPEFGEKIVAAVICKPGASVTLNSVRAFLEPRLAKFKIPRQIDVHDALPRQDSGKIYKAKLRAPYWEGAGRQV